MYIGILAYDEYAITTAEGGGSKRLNPRVVVLPVTTPFEERNGMELQHRSVGLTSRVFILAVGENEQRVRWIARQHAAKMFPNDRLG